MVLAEDDDISRTNHLQCPGGINAIEAWVLEGGICSKWGRRSRVGLVIGLERDKVGVQQNQWRISHSQSRSV